MKLSVIVPCFNEAGYIETLLDRLVDEAGDDCEIIVVDSKSTDTTVEVVRRYIAQHKGTHLRLVVGPRGVANARNAGAAAAKGDWLYFLDADVGIPKDFLRNSVAEAERRNLQVATPQTRTTSRHPLDRIGIRLTAVYARCLASLGMPHAAGYAILATKKIHEQIGGFDPALRMGEDHYYAIQGVRKGARFGYLTSTHVIMSLRRFEEGGRMRELMLNIASEFYRLTHGFRIETDRFKYRFGNHRPVSQKPAPARDTKPAA